MEEWELGRHEELSSGAGGEGLGHVFGEVFGLVREVMGKTLLVWEL